MTSTEDMVRCTERTLTPTLASVISSILFEASSACYSRFSALTSFLGLRPCSAHARVPCESEDLVPRACRCNGQYFAGIPACNLSPMPLLFRSYKVVMKTNKDGRTRMDGWTRTMALWSLVT